jgi:hypothetical protein
LRTSARHPRSWPTFVGKPKPADGLRLEQPDLCRGFDSAPCSVELRSNIRASGALVLLWSTRAARPAMGSE